MPEIQVTSLLTRLPRALRYQGAQLTRISKILDSPLIFVHSCLDLLQSYTLAAYRGLLVH